MSTNYNEHITWDKDYVPEYCNGTLNNYCRNRNTKLVDLGVFYDSTVPGVSGGFWFCEDCHTSFGAGSRKGDHSARYELQPDGSWLLTEGGKYFRQSSDKNMVNNQEKYGNTILHDAVVSGDTGFIEYLLDVDGIDLSIKNDHGQTPVELAEDIGDSEVKKLLANANTTQ